MKTEFDENIYDSDEALQDTRELDRQKRKRRRTWKAVGRFIDRVFGFILATCIMAGLGGLGLEYVLVKGPSPALRDTFVATMLETRRFRFIPNIFLTEEEVDDIEQSRLIHTDVPMDASLIKLSSDTDEGGAAPEYVEDEDGDGVILETINGNGYVGYMLTVLDPKRVFVGMPNSYGGVGLTLGEMCSKYEALGGINAGGFVDEGGTGMGGRPQGLTIIDGVCYNKGYGGGESFVGFDANGMMYVGYYTYDDAVELGIVSGVSFGPILIVNGESVYSASASSGVNPRTAIGQRSDGAVLMLVIDGRQSHSLGATHEDVVEIMLEHGAINACNMDGGSSTTMWYNGEYVNSVSAQFGAARPLPNAFLFK